MKSKMKKSEKKGKLVAFLLASLKGFSQIVFIENALTGFIILVAVTSTSLLLGTIALLSAFIGTAIGKIGGADEKSVNQGLHGFNPVLTGIALTLWLDGPHGWIIALIAAALTAILAAALMHLMKNTEMPILTFPFIIMTWFLLLASHKLNFFHLSPSLVPINLIDWHLDISGETDWVSGIFNGISQIFFLPTILAGVLLFVAVFLGGWKYGVFAIIGNLAGLLTAYALGAEHSLIFAGLYGYNAILTIIAVSVVFNTPANRFSILSGIIGACISVPVTAGLATYLLPLGLPALTMPFVLSTWLFLFARKVLPRL